MKLILYSVLIITLIPSLAWAEVSLSLSGYNSEDSMSMSLIGQNLDYGGLLYVEPQTLIYKNAGTSNDPDAFYNFAIRFNDDEIPSSATTESGGFVWTAEIMTPLDPYATYPDEIFAVNAKNFVHDYGTLKSSYGNNNVNVIEYVKTLNSAYTQSIGITPDDLQSQGVGTVPGEVSLPKDREPTSPQADLSEGFISMSNSYIHVESGPSTQTDNAYEKPDHSSTNSPTVSSDGEDGEIQDGRGFIHQMRVEGIDDWGRIKADIVGDVSASWSNQVDAQGSHIAFGMNVDGISKDAMKDLHMEAEGSDIPYQSLPPGDVEIDFSTVGELELEQYYQYALAQKEAFYNEYPSGETSDEPWTWYQVKQNAFVVSSEEEDSQDTEDQETATPELFKMLMGFYIEDNK